MGKSVKKYEHKKENESHKKAGCLSFTGLTSRYSPLQADNCFWSAALCASGRISADLETQSGLPL